MVWCAIVMAIALLTGHPGVIPVCGAPEGTLENASDYMDPKVSALPDESDRPVLARLPDARSGARIMGRATWYDWRPREAAAGPALRAALVDWRGATVIVRSGDRQVRVKLTDHCACGDRNGVPTVIDLDVASFEALAPRGAGVIAVEVIVP